MAGWLAWLQRGSCGVEIDWVRLDLPEQSWDEVSAPKLSNSAFCFWWCLLCLCSLARCFERLLRVCWLRCTTHFFYSFGSLDLLEWFFSDSGLSLRLD